MNTITIFGPDLNPTHQAQGMHHVHTAGCTHARRYSYVPDYYIETIEAETIADAVVAIYGDHIDEGSTIEECRLEMYFGPCALAALSSDD